MDICFRLLLGHFMGDYLLQPLAMALNKSPRKPLDEEGQKSEGRGGVPLKTALFWSIVHATVYSLCVCLWLWTASPVVFGLIFLTHWPLDFFSLGDKYLKLIKGRTLQRAAEDKSPFGPFNIAFTAVVYTIVDNGMHLMLMYPVVLLLQKGLI